MGRLLMIVAVMLGGCSQGASGPTTRPTTAIERQDQAMDDPFGYSPSFQDDPISGGGMTDLDKKGLKRDLNEVLNP